MLFAIIKFIIIQTILRLGTCYNCGKGGHLSYKCPQKKNYTNHRRENNNSLSPKKNNRQKCEETPKREEGKNEIDRITIIKQFYSK